MSEPAPPVRAPGAAAAPPVRVRAATRTIATALAAVGLMLGAAGPAPAQSEGSAQSPDRAGRVDRSNRANRADRSARLPRHALSFAPGVRWEGLDDALASESRYGARTANVAVAYRYRTDEWRAGAGGSWTAPRLMPAGLENATSYEAARFATLDGWAVRRVWRSADGRWRAFAGPALAADVGVRRHDYGGRESYRYDNAFVGLEAAGLLEWASPGGVRVTERVMVPVAGVAVRTGYTILASEGPVVSLDLPPAFLLFRHRLELRLPLRGPFALSAFHEGSLLRHRSPLVLAQAWQRLGLAFELAWGGP